MHARQSSAVLGWPTMTIGVLFVCTGNICRSPMAKGVFSTLVRRAGIADAFTIDSAGTYEGHVGAPASLLAIEAARRRGYDIADHKARLLTNEDLERFEHPMAMDRTTLPPCAGWRRAGSRTAPRC